MEISNLTLEREVWKVFQEKLLLPWVRDVQKHQSIKIEERKNRKEEKGGSLNRTMSERCVQWLIEKNIKEKQ